MMAVQPIWVLVLTLLTVVYRLEIQPFKEDYHMPIMEILLYVKKMMVVKQPVLDSMNVLKVMIQH